MWSKWLALLCCLCLPISALGFGGFEHTPPQLSADGKLRLALPAGDLKRARVFRATPIGVQIVEMERNAEEFVALITPGKLALIKYQFQVESADGRYHQSEYHYVRSSADRTLDTEIAALSDELRSLDTRTQQLENAFKSLEQTDAKLLAKRKPRELERAQELVKKAESDWLSRKRMAEETLARFETRAVTSARGAEAQRAREELAAQDELLWMTQAGVP